MSQENQHCIACGGKLRGRWQKKFCSRECSSRHHRTGARPQRDDWNVRLDPATGCWEWQGATKNGYGRTTVDYRNVLVHRHFFEMYHGELAAGEMACHTCDNRLCFNPEHLFRGDAKANYDDMVAKGRRPEQKRDGGRFVG